jgi:hypothetical protein
LIDPTEEVFHSEGVFDLPLRDQSSITKFASHNDRSHEPFRRTFFERGKHPGVSRDETEAVIRIEQVRH